MTPIFMGKITDYKLLLDNPTKYQQYIDSLSGHRVEIVVRKQKAKRSENQSRYYWGVVIELLSKELGYDQDEMHEILKYKFLQSNAMGLPYVKSTTKLSTGEFEEYLSKIKRWAAEFLHIVIPDPNEAV